MHATYALKRSDWIIVRHAFQNVSTLCWVPTGLWYVDMSWNSECAHLQIFHRNHTKKCPAACVIGLKVEVVLIEQLVACLPWLFLSLANRWREERLWLRAMPLEGAACIRWSVQAMRLRVLLHKNCHCTMTSRQWLQLTSCTARAVSNDDQFKSSQERTLSRSSKVVVCWQEHAAGCRCI